jgi:hypothetical protein
MKRFAIWSMVLGTLAIAGGASALAFDGTEATGSAPGSAPATAPAVVAPATADELAPVAAPVDNSRAWAAPHSISYDPTPID